MSAPLSVLVNLTWLAPGVVGGSEESTTDALRAILDHEHSIDLTLAVLNGFAGAHPDLAEACRCEVLDSTGENKLSRVLAEQTWLARRSVELDPDVVHHAGGVIPLRHPGRSVLTIHDLQPLDLPSNFPAAKRLYLRAMLGRSARAAEVICVPSQFTADRVTDLLGVTPERIEVVPWSVVGLDRVARQPGADEHAAPGVPEPPVLLYPAITYPHKNHETLLEAFARFAADEPGATLVLAGGEGSSEPAVLERIARPDLRGRVERPGRVSTEEMERLYRGATAVLVPSRYEGFGLPALEAMSRGVPLVVSSAGSLPEVVSIGDGFATPVDPVAPDDVGAWTRAMAVVAGLDPSQRRRVALEEAGAAARFSPLRTAGALGNAYRRAASGREEPRS